MTPLFHVSLYDRTQPRHLRVAEPDPVAHDAREVAPDLTLEARARHGILDCGKLRRPLRDLRIRWSRRRHDEHRENDHALHRLPFPTDGITTSVSDDVMPSSAAISRSSDRSSDSDKSCSVSPVASSVGVAEGI